MAYTPSKHTASNKPYAVSNKPADARNYFYDEDNFTYRPFLSKEEAIAYFNTADSRKGSFDIIINTGGTLSAGVITGGTNKIHWWKDVFTDAGLIEKVDPSVPSYVKSISEADINKWNTAATNAAKEETDPTVPSHVKSITTEDIIKWNENTTEVVGDPIELTFSAITALKAANNLDPYYVYKIIDRNCLVVTNSINTFYPQVYYIGTKVTTGMKTLIGTSVQFCFPGLGATDGDSASFIMAVGPDGELIRTNVKITNIATITSITAINADIDEILLILQRKVDKVEGKGLIDDTLLANITGFPAPGSASDPKNYKILEMGPNPNEYRWAKRNNIRTSTDDITHAVGDDIIVFNKAGVPEIGEADFKTINLLSPTLWRKQLLIKNASPSYKLHIGETYPLHNTVPLSGENKLITILNPGDSYLVNTDGTYLYAILGGGAKSGSGTVTPEYPVIPYTEGSPILTGTDGYIMVEKGVNFSRPLKISVIGDSHAEGLNYPVPLDLTNRLYYKLERTFTDHTINYGYSFPFSVQPLDLDATSKNISKFNYYSANWMPNGDNGNVDINRNITKAISFSPDIIFAVFTSNEPNFSVPVATAVARFKAMFDLAKSLGVRMCFTGTYPRNPYNSTQKQELRDINTQLKAAVGAENVLDLIDVLGDSNTNIRSEFNHDTVHINGNGNSEVALRFMEWVNTRTGITSIVGYEIQRSLDGVTGWTYYTTETLYYSTTITVDNNYYYRARRIYNTGNTSPWSDPARAMEGADNAPTADAGDPATITFTSPASLVTLDGSGSSPGADETIIGWQWEEISGNPNFSFRNFTDSSVSSTGGAEKVYARITAPGTFQFRLTVVNSSALSSTDIKAVTIQNPAANLTARFDFGPTGTPATTGWTAVRGEPTSSIITATDSNGITCGNQVLFLGNAGQAAFDNGYGSALSYKDNNDVTRSVPQTVMKGLWSDWGNNGKKIILSNVPAGNYKLRIFGSIVSVGGFNANTCFGTYQVIGEQTETSVNYGYFQNSNDQTDGVTIPVSPNSSGIITISILFGTPVSGTVLAGIINALELTSA